MLNEHLSIKACKALAGRAREQGLRCSAKEWWYVNEATEGRAPLDVISNATVCAPAFTVLEAMELLIRMGYPLNIGPADRLSCGTAEWFWQEWNDVLWWGPFDTPAAAVEGALQYLEIMEASDE
jgi:hypothetical protein